MMRRILANMALVIALAFPALAAAEAQKYSVDRSHSVAGFKIRHLVSTVAGRFDKFDGVLMMDPSNPGETLKIDATVQATSVNTGIEKRDNHLRSGDFFDVENHPELKFVSTGSKAAGENRVEVTGDLTMRGVTKPVTLTAEILGQGDNPFTGTPMVGLNLTGKVNRKDFGILWNNKLDNGGMVLSDDVTIDVLLEASVPKPESAKAES